MKSRIVEFKVAMDSEQAKLKNHKQVTLRVDFPEESIEEVYDAATKSFVIDLQGQIRSNWDKFRECDLPDIINFGDRLYGKKAKVVKVVLTPEEQASNTHKMLVLCTPGEVQEFVTTGKFPQRVIDQVKSNS